MLQMQSFKSNIQFHASLCYIFLFKCCFIAPLPTFDHIDWAASLSPNDNELYFSIFALKGTRNLVVSLVPLLRVFPAEG